MSVWYCARSGCKRAIVCAANQERFIASLHYFAAHKAVELRQP